MNEQNTIPVLLQKCGTSAVDFINAKPAILKECEARGFSACFYETGIHEIDTVVFPKSRAILVLCYSRSFLDRALFVLNRRKIHPIVLGINPETDTCSCIYFDRKKAIAMFADYFEKIGRTRTALFGINRNSSSDMQRLDAFIEYFGKEAKHSVFYNDGSLSSACSFFLTQKKRFDSVIAVNDLVAAKLIAAARDYGLSLPEELYICGTGNTCLCEFTDPTLTSVSLDYAEVGKAAVRLFDLIGKMPENACVMIALEGKLVIRASTGDMLLNAETLSSANDLLPENPKLIFVTDPDVLSLDRINQALSKCDEIDLEILSRLRAGFPREKAAFETNIGESTLRYRLDKICRITETHGKKELFALFDRYRIQFNVNERRKTK